MMKINAKTTLLPTNDNARPDWAILSGILGYSRTIEAPKSRAEATKLLRTMLKIAYEVDPIALTKRLAGDRIEKAAVRLGLMGRDREDLLVIVASRLGNRRGVKTTSKNKTNDFVRAWDPERSGIVAYVRGNAAFRIQDLIASQDPTVSRGGFLRGEGSLTSLDAFECDSMRDRLLSEACELPAEKHANRIQIAKIIRHNAEEKKAERRAARRAKLANA